VDFSDHHEIDRNYVRCLKILMAHHGYPMVATHDPRLIAIAAKLAVTHGRSPQRFEYQMLHGVRPAEQVRLAAEGSTVRVYVPFGAQWYGYLMRRLAERPANLAFFARSLLTTR
jgi:proline dehydrogenase